MATVLTHSSCALMQFVPGFVFTFLEWSSFLTIETILSLHFFFFFTVEVVTSVSALDSAPLGRSLTAEQETEAAELIN